MAQIIIDKENTPGILGRIFQSADAFDIMRSKKSLQFEYISLYSDFKHSAAAKQLIHQLAWQVRELIAGQYDLKHSCAIKHQQKVIYPDRSATRDASRPELKGNYEHDRGAHQKIVADFNSDQFPLLKKFYQDGVLLTEDQADKADYAHQSPIELDTLIDEFLSEITAKGLTNHNDILKAALSYFTNQVNNNLPVKAAGIAKTLKLSWPMIKTSLLNKLNLDAAHWRRLKVELAVPRFYEKRFKYKGRQIKITLAFDNRVAMDQYFVFIRSMLPRSDWQDITTGVFSNQSGVESHHINFFDDNHYNKFVRYCAGDFLIKSLRHDQFNFLPQWIAQVTRTLKNRLRDQGRLQETSLL